MSFTPDEVAALRAIQQALAGVDIVLVGAAALRHAGRFSWRTTSDLDLTVALDAQHYPGPLRALPGFRQDPNLEHRWFANQLTVDIIPAGPSLRRTGYVQWKDRVFNLSGFELVFQHAVEAKIRDLVIRIAPPPVIAILKMVAYSDRPDEREKDLQDIGYLLDEYIGNDDERRYADHVAGSIHWENVSPHELGYDIGRIVGPAEERLVAGFVARLRDGDALGTLFRMRRAGPSRWRFDEPAFFDALDAFDHGFRAGRGPT